MIPLLRPILVLGFVTGGSLALDRWTKLVPLRGAARWPLYAFAPLLLAYLACVTPVLAGLTAALVVAWAWVSRRRKPPGSPDPVPRGPTLGRAAFVGVAAILVLIAFSRPATPLYWDEFVWLAKARVGAPWPGPLVSAALSPELAPASPVIPPGYPLLYSLAAAWLGGFSAAPSAVFAGASVLEALVLVLFLAAAWDAGDGDDAFWRPVLAGFAVVTCPLLVVHLRATYVDFSLGMLAATLALLLRRGDTRAAPFIVAATLAGMKDEGLAHVGAVVLVAAIEAGIARAPRRVLVAGGAFVAALVTFTAWRHRLTRAGVVDSHHTLGLPDWTRVGPVLGQVGKEIVAVSNWGALWMLVAGAFAVVGVGWRRADAVARTCALTWVAQAAALLVAITSGPGRVMEFVLGGSLVNRLLVQLAPTGLLLFASTVRPATGGEHRQAS